MGFITEALNGDSPLFSSSPLRTISKSAFCMAVLSPSSATRAALPASADHVYTPSIYLRGKGKAEQMGRPPV